MPALLKCDVGTFAPDGILDGHLPIIFGAVLKVNFGPLFCCFSDDDLRVYLRFRDLKCRFWPFLDGFLHVLFCSFLGTCVTASRAVFEWPVFMTIPSRRMDSPR